MKKIDKGINEMNITNAFINDIDIKTYIQECMGISYKTFSKLWDKHIGIRINKMRMIYLTDEIERQKNEA